MLMVVAVSLTVHVVEGGKKEWKKGKNVQTALGPFLQHGDQSE